MQRRKDLFGEDSHEFRPEKWEDRSLPLYKDRIAASWAYLPFNGGPRVCLGRKSHHRLVTLYETNASPPSIEDFGLTVATYTVVRILQTFPQLEARTFSRPQEQEWLGWSSHHHNGLKRTAKERQKMTLVMSAGHGCPITFRRT